MSTDILTHLDQGILTAWHLAQEAGTWQKQRVMARQKLP